MLEGIIEVRGLKLQKEMIEMDEVKIFGEALREHLKEKD